MKRKFVLVNDSVRHRAIDAVATTPEGWEVEIKPHKAQRSNRQNSTYWMWVDHIRLHVADATGNFYTKDQLHEFLASKFLPTEVVTIAGEEKATRKSTAKLSTAEFAAYLDQVDRYCVTSLGLYLPQPGMEGAA